ncbi:MAG TPA: hypothetical protein VGI54_07715 [Solirubrobacteraceae bacterium]
MSVLVLAGCGGGGGGGADTQTTAGKSVAQAPAKTVTSPPRTAPATTPTMSTPTPPPAPAVKQKHTKPKGEGGAAGGGDEEGNFIPVAIALLPGGQARPPVVQVPAFFKLHVTLRNGDARSHRVALAGPGVGADQATLAAGRSVTFSVNGGKPTTFRVLADGSARARIMTGANPGP